ncbi:MAG: hypothetical protein JWR10_2459 [Rubritepida sp.]|nr:hypothetical protein [Rubritepida sp.]
MSENSTRVFTFIVMVAWAILPQTALPQANPSGNPTGLFLNAPPGGNTYSSGSQVAPMSRDAAPRGVISGDDPSATQCANLLAMAEAVPSLKSMPDYPGCLARSRRR